GRTGNRVGHGADLLVRAVGFRAGGGVAVLHRHTPDTRQGGPSPASPGNSVATARDFVPAHRQPAGRVEFIADVAPSQELALTFRFAKTTQGSEGAWRAGEGAWECGEGSSLWVPFLLPQHQQKKTNAKGQFLAALQKTPKCSTRQRPNERSVALAGRLDGRS